jgi:UDP-glucose 4-epimerase
LINEVLDSQIEPIYKERKKGDIRHSILDNSKALDYLDWEPKYEIEEGIKQTVKYYLQRRQNNG